MIKLSYKNREEWLELRRGFIGGSDAGAVAGMNPYKGPYAVWLDKTGKQTELDESSITLEVGSFLEQYVADKFTEITGKRVMKVKSMLMNELYPWACADIDRRVVGEDAILECKTTGSLTNMKLLRNGEYPMSWYCQMTHYLAVTGAKKAYLAVLINNREFKWFELERSQDEIDSLMRMEERFWQHVTENTPPEVAEADAETVSEYFRDKAGEDETALDLTPYMSVLDEYSEAVDAKRAAEEREGELRARLCAAMGEYTAAGCKGYRLTWKPQERRTFDMKAFTKANPNADLSGYYKVSSSRVFRFTKQEA